MEIKPCPSCGYGQRAAEEKNAALYKQIAWCECGEGLIQQEDGKYYCMACDQEYSLVKSFAPTDNPKWPEKKRLEEVLLGEKIDSIYAYNEAIDACIAAFEEWRKNASK